MTLPIVASGGAGKKEDFLELFQYPEMNIGLAASVFHTKEIDILELKEYLREQGVKVRL